MPRSSPHPLALFSLVPADGNERAKMVISHPDNSHLVLTLPSGTLALDIDFHIHGKSSITIATLGRAPEVDIYVEGSTISRIQYSLEINTDSGVVMFSDRSFTASTQVLGGNAIQFEYGRTRQVLVREGLNTIIGMGGERSDLIKFRLVWNKTTQEMAETIKDCGAPVHDRVDPRVAPTENGVPTGMPVSRETRTQVLGTPGPNMKYVKVHELGVGQYGEVHKVIDVDTGKLMAVKLLRQPTNILIQEGWEKSASHTFRRKVETLSSISHPHIVDYITSQGWSGPNVEIFIGIKEGTLRSLIERANMVTIAESVFPHMLRALDFIASKDIIHRDVKPDNILNSSLPDGKYQFQLGDFGLSNRVVKATTTKVGSLLYMAPEMHQPGRKTTKVDVWLLFVTMLWTLDAEVLFAASNMDQVSKIREMAVINPKERASAAQMIVKHFNGEGLSTLLNKILALSINPSPTTASARAPPTSMAPTLKRLAVRDAQAKSRVFRAVKTHLRSLIDWLPIRLMILPRHNPLTGCRARRNPHRLRVEFPLYLRG